MYVKGHAGLTLVMLYDVYDSIVCYHDDGVMPTYCIHCTIYIYILHSTTYIHYIIV